ncbi:chorismate-binding protein [Schinkia sp. CFF1]
MQTKSLETKKPLLSFEFRNSTGEIHPRTFSNPEQVIVANTMEEVLPCFQIIQNAVQDGYYAAGFLSYESAAAFNKAIRFKQGNLMPLLWFGLFSEPEYHSLSSKGTYHVTDWQTSITMDEYKTAISTIKQYIQNGDTYQVNYTIRLHSQFQGDDIAFFEKLKRAQASNYCAYINTGEHSILSASPELFFHLKDNIITTRPMKGTAKRGYSFAEDEAIVDWLYHSEKTVCYGHLL